MAEHSKIEWTDHTFNPWEGCQKVGPGCDHCYAETRNARFGTPKGQPPVAPNWGPGAPRRRTSPANWRKPLAWQADAARFLAEHGRRQRVFCASLADVFDNAVDPIWREELIELIERTWDLDWLLLTKRIGNVYKMVREIGRFQLPGHVILGATIVNQEEADRNIPKLGLLKSAGVAKTTFLSMEPLLGPVNLESWLLYQQCSNWFDEYGHAPSVDRSTGMQECCSRCDFTGIGDELAVDWVIAGGESGPGARPMHPDWARSLRDQCAAAGVPFLFKQWGEWAPICAIDNRGLEDSLYHPMLARHRPEGPRRCKVGQLVMQANGRIFPMDEWSRTSGEDPATGDFAYAAGTGAMMFMAIGKQRAGRLLDGVQHDGVPA